MVHLADVSIRTTLLRLLSVGEAATKDEVGFVSIQGNWQFRRINRRAFLRLGGMSAAALLMSGCDRGARPRSASAGYGPLVSDPGGVIDLPSNFQYRIISEKGSTL